MAAQIILFDLDGTLIRAGNAGSRSMAIAFNNLFFRENAFARISFTGMTDPAILRQAFMDTFNREPSSKEANVFFQEYLRVLSQEVPGAEKYEVLPGIPQVIQGLINKNMAVGLATGNLKDGARIKLQRADMWKRFPFGGFGSDSEDRVQLTAMAIQRGETLLGHGVDPQDCLVIGDSPAEAMVAGALGTKFLLVGTGWTGIEDLQALKPDIFVRDFSNWRAVVDAITDA